MRRSLSVLPLVLLNVAFLAACSSTPPDTEPGQVSAVSTPSATDRAHEVSEQSTSADALMFLVEHRSDFEIDPVQLATACEKVFGSAEEIAATLGADAVQGSHTYTSPVCAYGRIYFAITDFAKVGKPGDHPWGEFGPDGCRSDNIDGSFHECRKGDLVVQDGTWDRDAMTNEDRAKMASIVQAVRDQLPAA